MANEVAITITGEDTSAPAFSSAQDAQQGLSSQSADTSAALQQLTSDSDDAAQGADSAREAWSTFDEAGLTPVAASAGTTTAAMDGLGDAVSNLLGGLGPLQESVSGMAGGFAQLLGEDAMGGVAAVAAAGTAALAEMGSEAGGLMTNLTQLAATTGLPIEQADQLSLAFQDAGSNSQVLVRAGSMIDTAMQQAAAAMEKGGQASGKAKILQDDLNISLTNGATSGQVTTQVFQTLADMYQNTATRQQAISDAAALFGARMAGQVLPVIENYSQLQGTAAEQSAKFGSSLEGAQQKAIEFNTAETNLRVDFETLAVKVMPAFVGALDTVNNAFDNTTKLFGAIGSIGGSLMDKLGLGGGTEQINTLEQAEQKLATTTNGLERSALEQVIQKFKDQGAAAASAGTATVAATTSYTASAQGIALLGGRVDALTASLGETRTVTETVTTTAKQADAAFASQSATLAENKAAITQQIQGVDNQIKSLQLQKQQIDLSTQGHQANTTALQQHILQLEQEKQSLEVQSQKIADATTQLGLNKKALEEHTSTITETVGNDKNWNTVLGLERDSLEAVYQKIADNKSTLIDWNAAAKDAAQMASDFNAELAGMSNSLDKLKNVPTPELLALKAAQSDVNDEIAQYKLTLDAAGQSTDDHLKALEQQKTDIDDQVTALEDHRQKLIDDTKASDAAGMSADGLTKSESDLYNAITGYSTPALIDQANAAEQLSNAMQDAITSAAELAAAQGQVGISGGNASTSGHQLGGRVAFGATLVGEAGPELFVPSQPGEIISHDQLRAAMGGGSSSGPTNVTVNLGGMHFTGSMSAQDMMQAGQQVALQVAEALSAKGIKIG